MGKSVKHSRERYQASALYIQWAESLSGLLTTIKTEFGGVAEMLECSAWDEGKTEHALRLTLALRDHTTRIALEIENHVKGKASKRT